jgi:regulator of RNase E activity RraA
VHTAVHKGLGALGAVLGGMVGPSHAFVRPVNFNYPVTIHGMEVAHGDIIHADRHGAVVVPAAAVGRIADAVGLMSRKEARILEAANADGFGIEKLKQAIGASADIH